MPSTEWRLSHKQTNAQTQSAALSTKAGERLTQNTPSIFIHTAHTSNLSEEEKKTRKKTAATQDALAPER